MVPKKIIIHHVGGTGRDPMADTSGQSFEQVNAYHRDAKANGGFKYHYGYPSSLGYYLAYHYYIDREGKVTQARKDDEKGYHTIGQNDSSIGICLAGNFDRDIPNPKQTEALKKLLISLIDKWNIATIVPHRTYATKSCYGNRLSDSWARGLVQEHISFKLELLCKLLTMVQRLIPKVVGGPDKGCDGQHY